MDYAIAYFSEAVQEEILELPDTLAARYVVLTRRMVAIGPFDGMDRIAHILEGALPESSAEQLRPETFNAAIAVGSTLLALAGIGLAYAIYQAKVISAEALQKTFGPIHTLVANRYYIDALYENVIVRDLMYNNICRILQWIDTNIVDFTVNGSAQATRYMGDRLRWVQSGSVQVYGTVGFAGLLVASFLMLVLVER